MAELEKIVIKNMALKKYTLTLSTEVGPYYTLNQLVQKTSHGMFPIIIFYLYICISASLDTIWNTEFKVKTISTHTMVTVRQKRNANQPATATHLDKKTEIAIM